MGDHYQPGRYSRYDHRDHGYSRYDHRDDGYDKYDAYDRNGGYDRYRDDPYRARDSYSNYGHESRRDYYDNRESYPRNDNGFTFRGAAERAPQDARPQHTFSFSAPGPPAPRFPPADQSAPGNNNRSAAGERKGRARGSARGGRGGSGARGRSGFGPKPAHNRNILRSYGREPTPEQLEGMNVDGHERFKEVDSSSEAEMADVTEDDGPAPAKRIKIEGPAEHAVPKWSNPDPYTALPPPETLGAPKKDIVSVIRKAKVDAATKADSSSAVKENVDFISLNFDDDVADGNESLENDDDSVVELPPPNVPKAPSGYSHLHALHGDNKEKRAHAPPTSTAQPALPTFNAINSAPPVNANGGLPQPPAGFVMPTDEETIAHLIKGSKTNAKKRKRVETADTYHPDGREIVDEWLSDGRDPTPWCKIDHSRTANIGVRLHKEICDFYDFVKPYDYEAAVRQDLIVRVEEALRTSTAAGARTAQIECFGSFAAGLYLPTADMDLVALSQNFIHSATRTLVHSGTETINQRKAEMWKVARAMEKTGVAAPRGVTVIFKAKVPIVKFVDVQTGIHVDISFENDTGTKAIATFQDWKVRYPAMPVIVVLVKQMLAMRGLNEVFFGGLGGFSIICLVVSMMQLMPELQSGNMDPRSHYGDLLLNFLDLYGNKFDVQRTGIRLNPPGYFDKHIEYRVGNPRRLTIIDPNLADNDVSGGTSRINDVLDVFRNAHSKIQRRLHKIRAGENVQGSILECVLGGNYKSFMRQRDNLSLLHRGRPMTPPPASASQTVQDNAKKQADQSLQGTSIDYRATSKQNRYVTLPNRSTKISQKLPSPGGAR